MKKLIALLFILLYSAYSIACSTFLLSKNGKHVFGRNYDWVTGNGMVLVNAKGIKKASFTASGKPAAWVSKYGSITFNQFGKEFPHGGMNEKGLVVELMWLHETRYPAADNRAAMNELQWIQYQLDNCATVDEVIATDKTIRIQNDAAPLHYLIADANGNAATIEFLNGKMIVHRGKDLSYPVLTNTIYSDAVQQVKNKKGGDNSVERFATACNMIRQFRTTNTTQNAVDYSFHILDKIAQGNYTKWSIVYDISNRQIHFITNENRQRKSVSFAEVDFTCKEAALYFPLQHKASGNIAKQFAPLSYEQNKALIQQSALESKSQVNIPPAAIKGAAEYYRYVGCK